MFFDLQIGDTRIRNHWELIYPIFLSFIILILRFILERFLLFPLGICFGFSNPKRKKAPYIPILEKAYQNGQKWDVKQIKALSKQTDFSPEKIQDWFCVRKAQDKPTILQKFSESAWKLIYYTSIVLFATSVLWDKPWLWNYKQCWAGFYNQKLPNNVWWYFIISTSYMWSALFSLYFDVRRKDFFAMFVHHFAVITTAYICWKSNAVRMYILGLFLHDITDIFMELAKITRYLGLRRTCNCFFFIFTAVWIFCRFGLFPVVVIKNWIIDAPNFIPGLSHYLIYYIITGCLFIFVTLNSLWTVFILRIVANVIKTGNFEKDTRSDSEDE